MKKVIFFLSLGSCFLALWAVQAQRRQLTALRAEQEQQQASAPGAGSAEAAQRSAEQPEEQHAAPETVSSELLRLRGEVTRLNLRKRELAGVEGEGQRLRAELAKASNQPGSEVSLPPGFVRKSEAKNQGYSTPEATMETFLWALQHHDATNLLNAFAGPGANQVQLALERSAQTGEDFFKGSDVIPGLAIQNRTNLPDGSVNLTLEVAPGAPTQTLRLQSVNGEWKFMGAPF
jgi:hypothetical protein